MDSESEGKPEVNTKEKWMENQNGNVKIWFQSNRTQKRTDYDDAFPTHSN